VIADRKFLAEGRPLPDTLDGCPEGIVLPLDKPYRWTSADVIRKVKYAACRHFGKKNLKVGHAGTLDPLATGVLLVCIGKATKMAEELQKHDKEYVAGIAFGATTASYDREKPIDRLWPTGGVTEGSVRATMLSFLGEHEQVAPLFSAKSVDGQRAYELARKLYRKSGRDGTPFDQGMADLLSRQHIRIDRMELLDFRQGPGADTPLPGGLARTWADIPPDGLDFPKGICPEVPSEDAHNGRIHVHDNSSLGLPVATIRIACTKGTYIRALARDLGEALGSGAHLESLQRCATGDFRVEDALSVPEAMGLLQS